MRSFKILLLVCSVLLLFSCSHVDVTLESESFPFSRITRNGTAVFNDQIWTMIHDGPGEGPGRVGQQVWSTPDGINWSLRKENPFPETRYDVALLNYDGKLWAISATPVPRNDIRNSSDGINWELVADGDDTPFEFDDIELATVFDNKIVLFISYSAGVIGPSFDGTKIFSSTDGVNWTLETNLLDMNSDRSTVSVFNDEIYVIGSSPPSAFRGEIVPSKREMWRSPDCISWSKVTYPSDAYVFSARRYHSAVIHDSHLWVVGGEFESYDSSRGRFVPSRLTDDIWYTNDANEWRKVSENPPFNGIKQHTTINFNGKIWLFGGTRAYRREDGTISRQPNRKVWTITFKED